MGIRLSRNGELNAADGCIVSGVLKLDATVGERWNEAFVIEEEWDSTAAEHK